jgi:hypothetical protein
MDFIPAGYITIREAVDRILRKSHGDNWGKQEIELEADEITYPSAGADDDSLPINIGRPHDRKKVAAGKQQTRDAEGVLLTALVEEKLVAEIDDGPPVPRQYWQLSGAKTTLSTGHLQLGPAAKPEDLKWQHYRVLLKTENFDAWLNGIIGSTTETRGRKRNVANDALVQNKIESVLAAAGRKWKKGMPLPGRNQAARILIEERSIRDTGYSEETIRKILDGTYSASKRLKIPGFPGIDPRSK